MYLTTGWKCVVYAEPSSGRIWMIARRLYLQPGETLSCISLRVHVYFSQFLLNSLPCKNMCIICCDYVLKLYLILPGFWIKNVCTIVENMWCWPTALLSMVWLLHGSVESGWKKAVVGSRFSIQWVYGQYISTD